MTDVKTFIGRIDQELEAELKRTEINRAEAEEMERERGPKLERYEAVAKHIIELLKPRLAAFIERFKDVVKAEPSVREQTRVMHLEFASTVAKVSLHFEVFPDENVNHIRLECTQEIIPMVVEYDKQSAVEFPLEAVADDAVVQWFDERIVTFVKLYLALVRQDESLQEHLKDIFVEDPVAKIRFPKYLAASTLEQGGRTYYFVDEGTRREFEKLRAAKN
jgi:YHS domain-containing protein